MPENIHIKLPDGSEKEVPKGTTALDVARAISPRLADAAIAAKISSNGDKAGEGAHPTQVSPTKDQSDKNVRPTQELIDLTRPLEKDADLRILTEKDPEAL